MNECACEECVAACTRTPGWFAPNEAEKAAALLRIPFEKFREQHLIEDYWIGGAVVYAPRKGGVELDRKRASWGYAFVEGRCVFLDGENRCKIHDAKPMECRETSGCGNAGVQENIRESISDLWTKAGSPLGEE